MKYLWSDNSMARAAGRLNQLWQDYGIYVLALLFTTVITIFLVNKHNAFNTRTYDFARFSQAIWNTLDGRFLISSIDGRSILGNHFSPYMALLSPLLWIWPDERVLFLVQAASVAAAGLLLALILRRKHTALAPWFLLAFFLNPAVQQITLFEFRRVVLALPFLALALYALAEKRRWLMLLALLLALLSKEDIGLFVFGVGIFLLIFQRDWRWGATMMILGLAWSVVVSLWIIPAFRTPGTEYPQLFYFDYLGNSYEEIAATLQRDPLILPRQLISLDRLSALWRIFLPLGLFLPFLGAEWLLIALPALLLLLLSGDAEIYGLLKWYPATILPVFFAATAVGIGQFQLSKAHWLTVWLLLAALLGYWLYSPLPGGKQYEADLYQVTDHDRLVLAMIEEVPQGASVATQPHYVPHLAQREHLYHYPWIKIGRENIDYFLLDPQSSPYPFSVDEITAEINSFLADPTFTPIAEADSIYLFQRGGAGEPTFSSGAVAEEAIQLQSFAIAVEDGSGIYRPLDQLPLILNPGQRFRVSLYWQALAASEAERTVSLRAADGTGWLFAQHDGLPALGSKPTSWWQTGQQVRDVHYLTLAPDTPAGPLSLNMLLYDTFSQELISWQDGQEVQHLAEIEVRP
ncbi:MAG: DUF2079 domain-containing protein [Chloroflexi bacterium]|nr:DUF2079 domain-containing protein [Chloroflexota bacterium]